ncbi:L-threonylcarbamoyladenylate synthase type 1 TsaC [Rosenbergiella australiborealis]|uniref:Threonylcarbamoyl-AMP synthase n=1 Tax=Rosenbergiella australiborealis TaxID=1544696 RepID=A0ABS5T4I3_9GAMM|nr:Sua5/YciO/YrdC/YwlC family protein [Rosenbergiella australiborealis]MBT0727246.1 L-threonylcarbamoyladenylate synthase type 1 TsaC [Rosenbergiella australiborealis]
MPNINYQDSFSRCLVALNEGNVIAYPTEAVFGLGCDPDNQQAVEKLLLLKQRPVEKGLILIAASYEQLLPYIATNKISAEQTERMLKHWPGPVTFVVPASTYAPKWITGKFDSIAVRVTDHPVARLLCESLGKPLVSTSANLSGQPPARVWGDVMTQFGDDFSVVMAPTGGRENPSEIRDALTGERIREG